MIANIIAILAAVAGVWAARWISNEVKKWYSRYQRKEDSDTIEDARKAISEEAREEGEKKKSLDEIEDEFANR
jgi:hypothetical protein